MIWNNLIFAANRLEIETIETLKLKVYLQCISQYRHSISFSWLKLRQRWDWLGNTALRLHCQLTHSGSHCLVPIFQTKIVEINTMVTKQILHTSSSKVINNCMWNSTLLSWSSADTVAATSPIVVVSSIVAWYRDGSNRGLFRLRLTLTVATVVSVRGGVPPSRATTRSYQQNIK